MLLVMAGLVPAIHVLLVDSPPRKTWMPAFAGMTGKMSLVISLAVHIV